MDIFNSDEQQTLLDLLRRSDFGDALRVFRTLVEAAHSQGKVDGSKEMADHLLEKLDQPAPNPAFVDPPQIDELEADMRRTVLARFRPREEGSA